MIASGQMPINLISTTVQATECLNGRIKFIIHFISVRIVLNVATTMQELRKVLCWNGMFSQVLGNGGIQAFSLCNGKGTFCDGGRGSGRCMIFRRVFLVGCARPAFSGGWSGLNGLGSGGIWSILN